MTPKTKPVERPMTLEEMRADAKKKRDATALKKLQKKVDDYNVRARELGQPTITIADVS